MGIAKFANGWNLKGKNAIFPHLRCKASNVLINLSSLKVLRIKTQVTVDMHLYFESYCTCS